jgi:hypothetical protein
MRPQVKRFKQDALTSRTGKFIWWTTRACLNHARQCPAAQIAPGLIMVPAPEEGVGNAGCPVHPQPRARWGSLSMRTSVHSGGTGNHPAFAHANGFTAYGALPGDEFVLPPSPAN